MNLWALNGNKVQGDSRIGGGAMGRRFGRKVYFIDKTFQKKFILKFCLVLIISAVAIGTVLFFFLRGASTVTVENARVLVKRTSDFILPVIFYSVLGGTFLSACVALILTLVTSHKISGPLYRLKREIDGLKKGDFTRDFHIREDDQLQYLSKGLFDMNNILRGKHLLLKAKSHELKDFLEKSGLSTGEDERGEVSVLAQELVSLVDYFHV